MNVVSIRQKVSRAIAKAPTTIELYRAESLDDGAGGMYTGEGKLYATVEGLLDNSSHSGLSIQVNNGGKTTRGTTYSAPKFYTIHQADIVFKIGDYFIIDNVRYTITNAVNILNLDIYWELDTEVEVLS